MDGYYDGHPLVTLTRHIALAGLVTADTARIGHQLASLTGLTLIDLDRQIEHEAGRSVWEVILEEGAASYRLFENQCLDRALADRPYGVLVLGDGTLLDDENRRLVADQTTLVALERDLPNCYWRLQTIQQEQNRTAWHPMFPDPLTSLDQVRPFFQQRQPTLGVAHHALPMAGQSVGETVQRLMELLPSAAEAS